MDVRVLSSNLISDPDCIVGRVMINDAELDVGVWLLDEGRAGDTSDGDMVGDVPGLIEVLDIDRMDSDVPLEIIGAALRQHFESKGRS